MWRRLPRPLEVKIGHMTWCLHTQATRREAVITCKRSNGPLDVVAVVALNAMQVLAEDERRPGDEDDSGESENSEDAVQNSASLFQEDPGQQGGKHWVTTEPRTAGLKSNTAGGQLQGDGLKYGAWF